MKDNKLIAEFMRWDIKNLTTIPPNLHLSNLQLDNGDIMELKFHESWDWLMPVVERIEEMGCEVVITNAECTISGNDCYVESIGKSRRGATYKAVAEFINQYNKNK